MAVSPAHSYLSSQSGATGSKATNLTHFPPAPVTPPPSGPLRGRSPAVAAPDLVKQGLLERSKTWSAGAPARQQLPGQLRGVARRTSCDLGLLWRWDLRYTD